MRARIHAMLPEDVRMDGSRALDDSAWDGFITDHPELTGSGDDSDSVC